MLSVQKFQRPSVIRREDEECGHQLFPHPGNKTTSFFFIRAKNDVGMNERWETEGKYYDKMDSKVLLFGTASFLKRESKKANKRNPCPVSESQLLPPPRRRVTVSSCFAL